MTPQERESWEQGGWATWDTMLSHPVVLFMIGHLGFSEAVARRWVNIGLRGWAQPFDYERKPCYTVGEYLDADDDTLLWITNFGVKCLEVTHAMRQEVIR